MFKLESFTTPVPAPKVEVTFTQEDLDQAKAQGIALGQSAAYDEQLQQLTASLAEIATNLAMNESSRRQLRQEAVAALSPILHHILDLTTPLSISGRLEAALLEELSRLAAQSQPVTLRIACGNRLRCMVDRCLSQTGLQDIHVQMSDDDGITVTLQGGRIEFAPDEIANNIHALISDITQETSTWTH